MRSATFEVPVEVIGDFTDKLIELELENSIIGRTKEDEIKILVNYGKDDSDKIDELEEFLEEISQDLYEDEDEEEEDKD